MEKVYEHPVNPPSRQTNDRSQWQEGGAPTASHPGDQLCKPEGNQAAQGTGQGPFQSQPLKATSWGPPDLYPHPRNCLWPISTLFWNVPLKPVSLSLLGPGKELGRRGSQCAVLVASLPPTSAAHDLNQPQHRTEFSLENRVLNQRHRLSPRRSSDKPCTAHSPHRSLRRMEAHKAQVENFAPLLEPLWTPPPQGGSRLRPEVQKA